MTTVLFLNSTLKSCGIYQFGYNIVTALINSASTKYKYYYAECGNVPTFIQLINECRPNIVILNCVWAQHSGIYNLEVSDQLTCIDILHESSHYNHYNHNKIFKNHIIANPNIAYLQLGQKFHALPRLLPGVTVKPFITKEIPSIGCCSFGSRDRGWENIIDVTQRDFDQAVIKFHMPFNDVVDPNGIHHARNTAEICRKKPLKPGITLEIDHTFLSITDTVHFLSQNTINLFLYTELNRKGISSSIDFALAAKRPFGINYSPMYEHLQDIEPKINVCKNSLQSIIELGTDIHEPYIDKWKSSAFCNTFEQTLNEIVTKD